MPGRDLRSRTELATHPELLEILRVLQSLDLLNLVVPDVHHPQLGVSFQPQQAVQAVVRDVDLLERGEGREVLELGDSVRLDGKDFKRGEGGEVLKGRGSD